MSPAPVPTIDRRAAEDLQFIRRTMEQSATFTAVPGAGGAAMGVLGLVAAAAAHQQPTPDRWLAVWIGVAVVAACVGTSTLVWKAMGASVRLTGTNARRFAVGLTAPFAAGAGITYTLWTTSTYEAMPVAWLLLYGAGCLTGGAHSVPAVRGMGACIMLVGLAAAVTPAAWGDIWLGLGFGLLQIVFGLYIAKHHGG